MLGSSSISWSSGEIGFRDFFVLFIIPHILFAKTLYIFVWILLQTDFILSVCVISVHCIYVNIWTSIELYREDIKEDLVSMCQDGHEKFGLSGEDAWVGISGE